MPEPLKSILKSEPAKGTGKIDTRILKTIQGAKENEKEAARYYEDAARRETDAVGKILFQQLTEFEKYHLAKLSALEENLLVEGAYIKYERLEPPSTPRITVGQSRLPETSSTMGILQQAVQREREAENSYLKLADEIADPDGHFMFSRLSEEEHLHFHILKEVLWNLSHGGSWEWTIH